jgi:Xaa-Pro aminopeptidase
MSDRARIGLLRQAMERRNLAVLLVTRPENRRYLSGFTGSAGVLLITQDRQAVATDFRYYEQVVTQCPDWELFRVGYDFDAKLPALLRELGVQGAPVGFEATHVTVAQLSRWRAALGDSQALLETVELVEELRQVKDEGELQAIRRAVEIADNAFSQVLHELRPGLTERAVAWQMESAMRLQGASAVAFDLIVASGPNSALPHARAGDRIIQAGEPVVFDFGCVVDGYCSDATRTICLGRPEDDQYLEIWNLVQQAQDHALAGVKGGMGGVEADALARDVIASAGYAEQFGHGLGHGIGLAAQENPRLSVTYPGAVPAGAVVTVEPGVYLPGWGGVRIEDLVVVREDGVEVLTRAPKFPVL